MTTSGVRLTIERAVMWRSERVGTLELCRLKQLSDPVGTGWMLAGFGVARVDGELVEFNYQVDCDDGWRTLGASVYLGAADGRQVVLAHSGNGWEGKELRLPVEGDGAPAPVRLDVMSGFAGCEDVDIGVTPSTNTLPIRRLNLQVGESAEVTAAWVRFPELTVEPLAQRYMRLDERRYRYESNTGFVAELEVDELGLVVRYGDLWERVAG